MFLMIEYEVIYLSISWVFSYSHQQTFKTERLFGAWGFEMTKVTLSIIKADVGGWPGHATVHPRLMEIANEMLSKAREETTIKDATTTAMSMK
jgi:hypothetical protein